MTKQFTPWQLFSLVDGRLSTETKDVYEMLGHIYDEPGLTTNCIPAAWSYIKLKEPKWFRDYKIKLENLKSIFGNEYETLRGIINKVWGGPIEIPQLKDEFDVSDFPTYRGTFSVIN